MSLRVLAVSAPHWVSDVNSTDLTYSFNSETPFSLQNALRDAVDKAITGFSKAWSKSNFRNFKSRNESVILLQFWKQDKAYFEKMFEKINPNILFIGAMSLSFRGALEVAKYAKKKKGKDIFIVLGGKHINETFFKSRDKKRFLNHIGSPLKLMHEKTIPHVFDLVISGDGEKIITTVGDIIGDLLDRGSSFENFSRNSNITKLEEASGNWIAGQLIQNEIKYYSSKLGNDIDYSSLAYPIEQFELKKGFQIFNTDYTVHLYSDGSRGCGYDCFFCSEKSSINGKLRIKDETSVNRLFQQFSIIRKLKEEKYKNQSISAFIEDSIFLTGSPGFLKSFSERCIENNTRIKFGAQFTLDTFLSLDNDIKEKLIDTGLDYVAFGIETINDDLAKNFSKNTDKKTEWLDKTEQTVRECSKLGLKCGMFLIWGLGESQNDRIKQLNQILKWIYIYNIPIDVGLNIATQHPLQIVDDTHLNKFGYKKYNYLNWGTDEDDEYLPYFIELFGEASTRYAIYRDKLPTIEDLIDLRTLYVQIKEKTYSMV
ncbi:B12-binding domain-containing radical SAM protein [Pontimicrobium sp. MEBiC01747]